MTVTTVARPGWVVVEADGVRAVIEGAAEDAQRYAVAVAGGLLPLLESLVGGGLATMPGFAICEERAGSMRILVRGDGIARLGGEAVTAEGRIPWREVEVSDEAVEITGVARLGWLRPSRFDAPADSAGPIHHGPHDGAQAGAPPADEQPEKATAARTEVLDVVPVAPPAPERPVAPEPSAAEPPAVPPSKVSSLPWRRSAAAEAPVGPPGDAPAATPAVHHAAPMPTPIAEGPEPAADGPQVLSVRCPVGHVSPPNLPTCRQCGVAITAQQPQETPRPSLGVLVISTGGVVPLDRGVLLGRTPTIDPAVAPVERPHLVRLAGLDNDISRNHAEIRLEGWRVLVRDLGSTNGTAVIEAGGRRHRLQPHADHPIEPGTTIELADRVTLTYSLAE